MKQILLALQPGKINTASIDLACFLANLSNSAVNAVFLENIEKLEPAAELSMKAEGNQVPLSPGEEENDGNEQLRQDISFFRNACFRRSVLSNVKHSTGRPAHDVIELTRYSDLLIIDPSITFSEDNEGIPSDLVRKILADAECPVVISPERFDGISEIVFASDHESQGVFAIKQWAYIFPELTELPLTIVNIDEKPDDQENLKLEEWASRHFKKIRFEFRKASPRGIDSGLLSGLLNRERVFVVMGSYGRSAFSKFFHPSTADFLLKAVCQPFFITHR